MTSSSGSFLESNPATLAFDGNGNTYAYSDNGATITFAPKTPITVKEVCMIYSNISPESGTMTWQGVTTNRTAAGWTVFTNPDGSDQTGVIDENNPLTFTGPPGTASGFVGIFVDDGYLVDGLNKSFGPEGFRLRFEDPNDLGKDYSGNGNNFGATGFKYIETDNAYSWTTDTPSHNYCVLNENDCYFSDSIERASLGVVAAGGTGLVTVPGTIAVKGGKYYWEVLSPMLGHPTRLVSHSMTELLKEINSCRFNYR